MQIKVSMFDPGYNCIYMYVPTQNYWNQKLMFEKIFFQFQNT